MAGDMTTWQGKAFRFRLPGPQIPTILALGYILGLYRDNGNYYSIPSGNYYSILRGSGRLSKSAYIVLLTRSP